MSDELKDARDSVELVRLLGRLPYEEQPREQMREQLKMAKANINIKLDELDREGELTGVEDE